MNFVKIPNLPENPVNTLIIGQKYSNLLENLLLGRQITPIFVPDNLKVDARMAGHADLSVLHTGNNGLIIAKSVFNSIFSDELKLFGAEITVSGQEQSADYPMDANLNVCILGNRIIYNEKAVDRCVAKYLTSVSAQTIICNQGYSRCAVCIVDRHSIITADRGIAAAAQKAGLEVLVINNGLVDLPGFEYGFIGGASFKMSAHELALTGRILDSSEQSRIENFLSARNVKPIYLTDGKAFDIGGAIPFVEQYA